MSDIKVHPAVLKNLQAVLPSGATLTALVSTGIDTGEIRYKEADGKEVVSVITKASPMIGLGNRVLRYPAKQGDLLKDVVEKFCTQYRLMMMSGVDYDLGDRAVDFDGEPFYTEVIQVLPGSPFLLGNLTLILVDTEVETKLEVQDPNNKANRDIYILLSKPFEVLSPLDIDMRRGTLLSEEALDAICDHAKVCGGFVELTREILTRGEATQLQDDGVSKYTVVTTKLGDFGIRFKSE